MLKYSSPLRSKLIQAEFIEMVCGEHGCKGVYRYDNSRDISICYDNKSYPHRCSHCGHEVWIAIMYPVIKFKGENWVLSKNVGGDITPTNY